MEMEAIIRGLPDQFFFEPKVLRGEQLLSVERAIIAGMGGSHLPADMLKTILPGFSLRVHHDYGLPLIEKTEGTLLVAVSYSGDTEETLDFAKEAFAAHLPLAIISSGGALTAFAEKNNLPFVSVPVGFPQRMAAGYLSVSMLALLGKEKERLALAKAARALSTDEAEREGKELAKFFVDDIALLYSSAANSPFTYYLKALLNETAKLSAFTNVFPELNHNEMTGILSGDRLPEFRFLLVRDASDHPRVLKRMDIYANLLGTLKGHLREVLMPPDPFERFVRFAVMANWTAYEAATLRKVDPFDISLIERFKEQMLGD